MVRAPEPFGSDVGVRLIGIVRQGDVAIALVEFTLPTESTAEFIELLFSAEGEDAP